MRSLAPAEKAPAAKPRQVGFTHEFAQRKPSRPAATITASEQQTTPACTACVASGAPCPACAGGAQMLQRQVLGSGSRGATIQAKLTVGEPNDIYEQEADRVAEQVMRMPQRDRPIQREIVPEKEEERIQMMPSLQRTLCGNLEAEGNPEGRLNSSKGGGSPLADDVRSFMEPRFGADFSQVRVHTGSESVQLNQDLNAQAFTHRQDIYFGAGKAPAKDALTAHELTHVAQQKDYGPSVQPLPSAISSVGHRIQKDPGPVAVPLIDRYRDTLKNGDWIQAAVLLNGFNDADIQLLTSELSPVSRRLLRLSTPDWAFRVRRPLLMLDYNSAKSELRWSDAAILLNGFNDADIQLLASQLTPTEVGPLIHGAREGMQGPSLGRVIHGISRRYDEISPDPPGTKVLTVVGLMQAAGVDIHVASTYLQIKLDVRVAKGASSVNTDASHDSDLTTLAAAIKGASAGATVAGAGAGSGAGVGARRLQPEHLTKANEAHEIIGDIYTKQNFPSYSDFSVADILGLAKGKISGLAKAIKASQANLFLNFDMRPDIVDLGRLQIFEIKKIGSTAQAVSEAKLYIELFDSLNIPGLQFTLGNPGNPGTQGTVPGPDEILVWGSPLPGAIVYTFVRPPENPRSVQDRITNGAYEPGLGLGPQAFIALGFAGVALGTSIPEISAAAVASYETLLPILIPATRSAGQAIPKLLQSVSSQGM